MWMSDPTPPNDGDFLKNLDLQPEYSPFHPELDQKFPIDQMLSEENMKDVSSGKVQNLNWVSFFRNSPAQNSEAEILMGQFVVAASRAGQWVDMPLKSDEPIGGEVDTPLGKINFGNVTLEFTRGGQILVDNEFAKKVTDDDGRQWFAPTEKLLEFVSVRLQPFGPQTNEPKK